MRNTDAVTTGGDCAGFGSLDSSACAAACSAVLPYFIDVEIVWEVKRGGVALGGGGSGLGGGSGRLGGDVDVIRVCGSRGSGGGDRSLCTNIHLGVWSF